MTIDAKIERKVITGMITSDSFLKNIQPLLTTTSLQISFTKKVASWCNSYYAKYQKAPNKHIQDIFKQQEKKMDKEEKFLTSEFLEKLSEEYSRSDKFNEEFVLDQAKEYFRSIALHNLKEKISTALEKGNTSKAEKLVEEFKPLKDAENIEDVFEKVITARELKDMTLPEVTWIVEGVVPRGLTLLAGKPKVGKSYWLLNLAIDVALGRRAFNAISTDSSRVLYLGLEEPRQRTKSRIESIVGDGEWPGDKLHIVGLGDWPKSDEGGFDRLEIWMKQYPDTKLIIIDTLAKWKSPKKKTNRSEYEEEYQSLEKLHTFAGNHDIAVEVAHHMRKTEAYDRFDEICGGVGLQASVDSLAVLFNDKNNKDKNSRTYKYRGRDIGEDKKTFKFEASGRMVLSDEEASEYRKENKQRRLIKEVVESLRFVKRKDLVDMLKGNVGKGVDTILARMVKAGMIEKRAYGEYAYKGYLADKKGQTAIDKLRIALDNEELLEKTG